MTVFNSYDGLGQRVRKSVANVPIYFVYDESGQLLGEYDQSGNMIREYIWLGSRIVGMYSQDVPNTLLRVHTDHLGTVRAVSQGDGATLQVLWRFEGDAFGDVQPTAVVNNFTMPIRMPGQYYDAEVGTSYNYFRDYDPSTGRYVESDPIGLDGGNNTYGYVGGSPDQYKDPFGLVKHTTGKTIQCSKNCTIRIDYSFDQRTGTKKRHMHWSCKGREGACGENGDPSHGGSWDDAPQEVKDCARRNGFSGEVAPVSPTPRINNPPEIPPEYNYPNSIPASKPDIPIWPILLIGAGAAAMATF